MEEVNFEREKVVAACHQIVGSNHQEVENAKQYLAAFENSPQFWIICCEILDVDYQDQSTTTSMASLLRRKLQYDVHQLPQTEYLKMSQTILKIVKKHSPAIVSLLCRSFGYLYAHAFRLVGNLLETLTQNFLDATNKHIALKIIKAIARVIHDSKFVISKKQMDQYIAHLDEYIKPKVFRMIDKICENILPHEMKIAVKAFKEWVDFSRADSSIIDTISSHKCFTIALDLMNDKLSSKTAQSCLTLIIQIVKNPEQHPPILSTILDNILKYMDQCKIYVQKNCNINAPSVDITWDPELELQHMLYYFKVFRAFGMKTAGLMINEPNEKFLQFLEFLVKSTEAEFLPLDILADLEDFWRRFADRFVDMLEDENNLPKLKQFEGLLGKLILIALKRMRMKEDQLKYIEMFDKVKIKEGIETEQVEEENHNGNEGVEDQLDDEDGNLEEVNEKNDERKLCQEIIASVQEIVGFQAVFNILLRFLREMIITAQQNGTGSSNSQQAWEIISNIECIMYTAKACIKMQKEKIELAEFFQAIMSLNFNSLRYNVTKIRLMSEAADVAILNEQTTLLIFNYLADNITKPKLKADVEEALISLCENSSSFVMNRFEAFQILINKLNENESLIAALALSIANDTETNRKEIYLTKLCKPFAERLLANMAKPNSQDDPTIINDIAEDVKTLGLIFKNIATVDKKEDPHPLARVFQELWPVSSLFSCMCINVQKLEEKISLTVSNLVLRCMKILTTQFKPYILELFDLICKLFVVNYSSNFIYAIELSARIFAHLPEMVEPLTRIYEFISEATLKYLIGKDLKDQSELLEDFFGMLCRFTKYIPSVFLSSKSLELNLYLVDLSIDIGFENVEKSLYLFLEYLFRFIKFDPKEEREKAITEIVVNKYGAIYIKKLIIELTKYPSAIIRDYIIDIINASFCKMKQHTIDWLKEAFQNVPEAILTQSEKEDMFSSLAEIDTSNINDNPDIEQVNQERFKICDQLLEVFDHFLRR